MQICKRCARTVARVCQSDTEQTLNCSTTWVFAPHWGKARGWDDMVAEARAKVGRD